MLTSRQIQDSVTEGHFIGGTSTRYTNCDGFWADLVTWSNRLPSVPVSAQPSTSAVCWSMATPWLRATTAETMAKTICRRQGCSGNLRSSPSKCSNVMFFVDDEAVHHSPDASILSSAGLALVMRQFLSSSRKLGTLAAPISSLVIKDSDMIRSNRTRTGARVCSSIRLFPGRPYGQQKADRTSGLKGTTRNVDRHAVDPDGS